MTVEQFFALPHRDREQVESMFPRRPIATASRPTGVAKSRKQKLAKAADLLAAAQKVVNTVLGEFTSPDGDDDSSDHDTSTDGSSESSISNNALEKRNGICLRSNRPVIPQGVLEGQIGKTFPLTSYDSPEGIHNPDSIRCFRNALLQCLFHVPEFYHLLGNIHKDCDKQPDQCITCALQRMTQDYWNGNRGTEELNDDSDILHRALKHVLTFDETIQNDEQSDPYPLLLNFVRFIEWNAFGVDPLTNGFQSRPFDETDPDSFSISKLFEFEYSLYLTCRVCGEPWPTAKIKELGFSLKVRHKRKSKKWYKVSTRRA